MGKSFSALGMCFVKFKAASDQIQHLLVGKDIGHFHAKPWMAAQSSAQKHPVAGSAGVQGAGGAGAHAFAAGNTGGRVDFRALVIQ